MIVWLPKLARCLILLLSLTSLTQVTLSQTKEKPKLKDFGSSLDRLKWDKKKQAAVEKNSSKKTSHDDQDVIRVDTQLIAADVLVLDRQGQPVRELTKDDFIISEDGEPQRIDHFSLGTDQTVPKTIVLIMDYSGSEVPYIEKSTSAAKRLVDYLGPEDRMAIVTDDVRLVVNFTSDRKTLKRALDDLLMLVRMGAHGKSQQFSALMATARELISNEDLRPIIVFQTDGDQSRFLQPHSDKAFGSVPALIQRFSLDDIVLALDKARVTVYTVIPQIRLIGLSEGELPQQTKELMKKAGRIFGFSANYPKKDLLKFARETYLPAQQAAAKVATATGGWTAFLELPEQADEIYSRIMSDVDSRYVLGYYYPPGKVRDGKRHSLSITVKNHPEYQIAGRKSFIAPLPNP